MLLRRALPATRHNSAHPFLFMRWVLGEHRYDNDFGGLFNKYRAHLFGRIDFPVPLPTKRKVFPALYSSQLCRLPWRGADRFLNFNGAKAATEKIAGRVSGKADWLHLTAFFTTSV
jgi:hypothetical protein